jgi:hypothetical protein
VFILFFFSATINKKRHLMFEESFNLVQHTPIIHFKPDTPIRTTELKPAFDRYLMKKFNYKDEKEFKKEYRYKVFVEVESFEKEPIYFEKYDKRTGKKKKILKTHLFFGDKEKYVFVKNVKANIVFRSFNKELLIKIRKYFPSFLSQYNFATRKSKGYGSFTAEDSTLYIPSNKRIFKIVLSVDNWDKELSYFYKSLRQGINERGFYTKPLIFEYACNKKYNWEKKRIKEFLDENNIIHNRANYEVNGCDNRPYRIVRDVFGLSTFQRWMGYNVNILKDGQFDRYPSPLFFKPIKRGEKMNVYFWIKEYEEDIRGKKFKIKCNNRFIDELEVINIDWNKFFNLMLKKKNCFNKHSHNEIEKMLGKIYDSLKEIK